MNDLEVKRYEINGPYALEQLIGRMNKYLLSHTEHGGNFLKMNIVVERWVPLKSHDQLKMFHAIAVEACKIAYHEFGQSMKPDEMKYILKKDYGFTREFEFNNEKYIEVKSLKDISKEEMRGFIDFTLNWIFEKFNVRLDDPRK